MENIVALLKKRFDYYRKLGDDSMAQLNDEQIFWAPNEESNSVAVIVQHIAGNMLSRWTDFLTQDGEKPWRNRDQEFISRFSTKDEVHDYWNKGWACFEEALQQVNDNTLYSEIEIRSEKHTVLDALLRQLAHYPYHIGQMVYIAKILKNQDWKTLSIARNRSAEFNREMAGRKASEDFGHFSSPICFANSHEVRKDYQDPPSNDSNLKV